ncbi:hypothetical protein NL676_003825 [Syzygium grande]|nr:hypothetical protein NL676_003825 [Syzygium grande]
MAHALPLQTSNIANTAAANAAVATRKGRTVKETNQKKSQLEHILLLLDTYISSVEKHTSRAWVYKGNEVVHRPVAYVPSLYKILMRSLSMPPTTSSGSL